jgi:deoxyribodipyrimidine photo-lyase
MAYDDAPDLVRAWKHGRTGIPLVDAGMRQLLATGWMHNRVRMVTASFLVKHLHTRWQVGAQHFLDHLIDADLASNQHGWQWVAGTGTDAAPYFRVFNPVLQGEKFDPDARYIRHWIPELARLDPRRAHRPWTVAHNARSGYPDPIVDLDEERRDALLRHRAARA